MTKSSSSMPRSFASLLVTLAVLVGQVRVGHSDAPSVSELTVELSPQHVTGVTYYVSASAGNDANAGTSAAAPFRTIAKVNSLLLAPGDAVRFRCGDVWRGEMLRVTRSGSVTGTITFGSYPDPACPDKPILSGSQPITGWTLHAGQIWRADLDAIGNTDRFTGTQGINQLFRDGRRLGIGRWPNLDAPDGGYSTIDAQPAGNQITDHDLPAVDWSGATAHIKGMRWYILNRNVTADSGNTLTLNAAVSCYGGGCAGWGFWLDSHLATLDRDGEWYYDPDARRVYLFSVTDPNQSAIEGSVVLNGESANLGGVILGRHLQEHVAYIVLDNLDIRNWFDNGVTTPVNLEKDEHSHVVIRNCAIRDVDSVGINLATWVWNAASHGNGYNGWRGGRYITITNNLIEGANHFGINSYARLSLFEDNVIRDIGLIANLNRSGTGCGITAGEGGCTEDGDGIRLKDSNDGAYTSNHVTLRYNRLERIGYNGMDIFGGNNTVDRNVILFACHAKGDCGAARVFGSLAQNIVFTGNLLLHPIGNTDGAIPTYDPLFGFGLYLDENATNITVTNNTLVNATATGLLFQRTTGSATGNTLFRNASATDWSGQASIGPSPAYVSTFTNNILLGVGANTYTLRANDAGRLGTSNQNRFYHAVRANHIHSLSDRTLAQWQTYSGKDAASTELVSATLASAVIFYNDTKTVKVFPLVQTYQDLNGVPVSGSLTLAPFTSRILIPIGVAPHRVFAPMARR